MSWPADCSLKPRRRRRPILNCCTCSHLQPWMLCFVVLCNVCFDTVFSIVAAQLPLFQQNAWGTRAPPGQPLCEQNVQWSGVHWTSQKIWSQQESRCALHLWGLSHHSHFQREGSEAHTHAHEEWRPKAESKEGTGGPAHGHNISLWDVGLFPLHHRGWVAQTRPPAFLFHREALQSAELCGRTQVRQLAAQWDVAAEQRALHHVWVQTLQVCNEASKSVTCVICSTVSLSRWLPIKSSYRENVVSNLSDRAFDRPICEVLLNQKYFNGIGNYLRAEILFRWSTYTTTIYIIH